MKTKTHEKPMVVVLTQMSPRAINYSWSMCSNNHPLNCLVRYLLFWLPCLCAWCFSAQSWAKLCFVLRLYELRGRGRKESTSLLPKMELPAVNLQARRIYEQRHWPFCRLITETVCCWTRCLDSAAFIGPFTWCRTVGSM